jgi:hypothetical protein
MESGKINNDQLGRNPTNHTISARATSERVYSVIAKRARRIGKIHMGIGTCNNIFSPEISAVLPCPMHIVKHCHGKRHAKRCNANPPGPVSREKRNEKATVIAESMRIGFSNDQTNPRTERRYFKARSWRRKL